MNLKKITALVKIQRVIALQQMIVIMIVINFQCLAPVLRPLHTKLHRTLELVGIEWTPQVATLRWKRRIVSFTIW